MQKIMINVVILCDFVIFIFFENCILSKESYAFSKVTVKNQMGYAKGRKKWVF